MKSNLFEKCNNILISILLFKWIYNISYNKITKFADWIKLSFNSINYYPISMSFMSLISFSDNDKTNLKKVNPKENISLFSGLNSPIPDLL